jgi:hypothetical protein
MVARRVRIWSGLALFAIVASVAALLYIWGSAVFWGDRLEAGERVSDLALTLLADRIQSGDTETMIVFVDCDCPSCRGLLEELAGARPDSGPPGPGPMVTFVSRAPCSLLDALGPRYRVWIDRRGEVFGAFGIWQVPSALEIDAKGRIRESRFGWNVDEVVRRYVRTGR